MVAFFSLKMGIIYSFIFGYGRTDDPDPITGLTSREKYLVRTTWKEAMSDPIKLGVGLLTEFLDTYPGYIKLFPFRNLPPSEFAANKKFQAHCANIVYTLGAVIDSLDNGEVLVEMLKKSGESHGRRKIKAKSYWELKPIALKHVAARSPKTFTAEAKAAWEKTVDVAFKVITSALDEKEEN